MNHIDGSIFGERNRCFGCGPSHPHGFRLEFRVEGDEVVTEFTPRGDQEGVPSMMHGGLAATVADEIGGWVLIALRHRFGLTGTMSCRFPRPIRIGVPVEGRGRMVKENARAGYVEVRLTQGGVECFTSSMTFILLDQYSAERMVGGAVPEEWKQFLPKPRTPGASD